ncbi:hypothetical protein HPL003_17785 [Paenibacillus terrae HPL-003]|uniref:Uncharacterized protein n=1 Tax=Paenibacillus terrae (strain HPL-003) TaxID=985665 RepID=G7W0X4_PAETH|nr:hypothetical protein HPL003_17785 [Paenibacillus terrae HPL-003]
MQLIEQARIDSYNSREPVTLVVFSPFDVWHRNNNQYG